MFKGIWEGLMQIFNFENYKQIINIYKDSFGGPEWVLVALTIAILVIILGVIILLIFFGIRKLLRFGGRLNQEELLEEIVDLNNQVRNLMKEKK